MRSLLLLCLVILIHFCQSLREGYGESPPGVSLTTHNQTQELPPAAYAQETERIRKIVLNQGDNARALANLVQLARKLPTPATSQLYLDLANDYLQRGMHNQTANVLQQHLTQYPNQPNTAKALVTLLHLYSSTEVPHTHTHTHTHTQQASTASAGGQEQQGFLKYANYIADRTLQKNATLAKNPALTFQRAVITRLRGSTQAAQGRLTRLKHQADSGPWQSRARAEQWLQSDRKDEPPLQVVVCRRTDERPHLDGLLDEPLWNSTEPVQFAYDEGFLYFAIAYPKADDQAYESDARPRSYDADLAGHDHVRLRLDLDRDYATCFELSVDHRGQTNDRCWLDASWNPKWFVAAGGDNATWTIEAAIPWESLTTTPPQPTNAWAITWNRKLPPPPTPGEGASATGERFSLLLFQ